jgi:translocation and assembly module TamB
MVVFSGGRAPGPNAMESPGAGRPRRRLKRIITGVVLAPIVLAALVLLAVLVALGNLDRPWLKQRLLTSVESASGVRLDYQHARVALLSGLSLEGLVVRTPPPFERFAPELLRVGTLEVRWSPGALLSHAPRVDQVSARDVIFVLVADDTGATSLDALTGPAEPPAPDAPGASRQATDFMTAPRSFEDIELSNVALHLLRVRDDTVAEYWSLSGLAIEAEAKPRGAGWTLLARMGAASAPLSLELLRDGSGLAPARAALELALSAEVDASAARVRVDLDVLKQDFDPRFTLRPLLHGAVVAKFEPSQRRIAFDLERTRLTDGAEVQAQVLLPDDAEQAPVVNRALADIEVERVLRWLPEDWRPFTLESGKAHLDARDVTLTDMPQLGPQGALHLTVEATQLRDARTKLADGRLTLDATPDARQGLSAKLAFALQGLELQGPTAVRVSKASGELTGQQLRPDLASPLRVAGDVALSGTVASLDVRTATLKATAERMGLQLQAPLAGKPPFALSADVPVGSLLVTTAEGREVVKGPARVKLTASDVFPNVGEPVLTRAKGRLELDVGTLHAELDADKDTNVMTYALSARTPDLVAVRPFLPDTVATHIPWKQLAVALTSKGTLEALAFMPASLEHRTELRMQRPAWDDVSAREVVAVLSSKGDAWKHQAELDLKVEGMRVADADIEPQHQTLTLDLDRRKRALRMNVKSHAGLKLTLDAAVAFDRKARALRTDLKADLPALGPLSPLLAWAQVPKEVETKRLALNIDLHGSVLGVLKDLSEDGVPRFTPDPLHTVGFEGKVAVDASGVRWRQEGLFVNVPTAHWRLESHVDGPRRVVQHDLTAEKLTVGLNDRRLSFTNLSSESTATFTESWEAGDLELKHHLKVGAFEQQPALPYPIQDLDGSFTVRRTPDGVIRVPDLKLVHAGTRTRLDAQGRMELGKGQRRLGMRGKLEQDLEGLTQPGKLEGSGKVTAEFRMASPDLVTFRTYSSLGFQDVNLRMPEAGIVVEKLDGNVPVTENVRIADGKAELLNDLDINPYALLRFADQHPLLTRSGYMSVRSITTPLLSIAPLAGNLAINQNVVSMNQLEMGVRGGHITGQCVLNYQGRRSTLEAHVRATGVKSSRGEPFDGNAAVVINAGDRSVNGRAEILRIGNRHLLDLLDLEDPRHVDPATNRVRYALGLGYPKHVKVSFNHGFGSLRISMGGLARFIRIDDIRGIPMGPIVDRMLGTLTPPEALP